MTDKTVLKRVRKLLSNPKHWTKNALARRSDGMFTSPTGNEAISWCLYGALCKVAPNATGLAPITIVEMLEKPAKGALGLFNDTHTHAEVLDLLDKMIASL